MDMRELEVLIALCRAAPSVTALEHAERLLQQLSPYLSEAHFQTFRSSPFLRDIQPSPWEVLVRDVTSAVLAIGLNHSSLRQQAMHSIMSAVDVYCEQAKNVMFAQSSLSPGEATLDVERAAHTVTFTISLLGLLEALTSRTEMCSAEQRTAIIFKLKDMLSEKFMVVLEGTLSSIRNAHGPVMRDWRRLLRHYAAAGRPLGAMLMQNAFMHFVASAAALMVAPPSVVRGGNLLDYFCKPENLASPIDIAVDESALDSLTDLITDAYALLEADADYLQVSSSWQQQLAFTTKADCLISYLCCSLVNEDIADADLLMGWLESVLTNPVQLANDTLATVTLKAMVVLATTSKTFASGLARSLPKLIVQGRMTSETATVAAESFARILLRLSQDLIISTLYSLGNVLSTGSGSTKNNMSLFFDGNGSTHGSTRSYGQHGTTSTLSLLTNDTEETALVHGVVVSTIIAIASRCNDEKIRALAMSMLIQKIGRANATVDAKIIIGTAVVGLRGTAHELRPLLKLYAKIADECLVEENVVLAEAVS